MIDKRHRPFMHSDGFQPSALALGVQGLDLLKTNLTGLAVVARC
jgi:hypothetical protein